MRAPPRDSPSPADSLSRPHLFLALLCFTAFALLLRELPSGPLHTRAPCLPSGLSPLCSDDRSCLAHLPGASALQSTSPAALLPLVAPMTIVSVPRLEAMQRALRGLVERGVQGDLVETGVGRGGASALMALTSTALGSPRRVHLYDTFGAFPAPGKADGAAAAAWGGTAGPSEAEVRASLASAGVPVAAQTTFHVRDVLHTPLEDIPCQIALLRVDTDW